MNGLDMATLGVRLKLRPSEHFFPVLQLLTLWSFGTNWRELILIFCNGQLATFKATKIVYIWLGKILECWDMIWGVWVCVKDHGKWPKYNVRRLSYDGRQPKIGQFLRFFVYLARLPSYLSCLPSYLGHSTLHCPQVIPSLCRSSCVLV